VVELQPSKLKPGFVTTDKTKTSDGAAAAYSSIHSKTTDTPTKNDDLHALAEAWSTLPEPIKVAVLAMVKATSKPRGAKA
jgi:hypothetical protein